MYFLFRLFILLRPFKVSFCPFNVEMWILFQVSVTVERAIPETQDVETRGTLFQQLLDLADLLLDGYSSQLQSLRLSQQQSERYTQLLRKYEDERRKLAEPLCKRFTLSSILFPPRPL